MGDGFEELVKLDRLAQEGRESQPPRLRFPVGKTREAHNRDAGEPRVGELEASKLLSTHPRHLEVEEDDARSFAVSKKGESVLSVFRGERAIALLLDHFPKDLEKVAVVVHDEDGGRRLASVGRHCRKSYLSRDAERAFSTPRKCGEPRRTRTFNLEIKSLLLYQLS